MFFIASSAGHSWFLGWVLRVIMSQLFIHVHSSCHIPLFTPLDTGKIETLCFSHPFLHILPASLCNSTTLRTSSYSCGPGSCRPCSTRKHHSVYCLYSLSSAFLCPHFPLHFGGKSLAQIKKLQGEKNTWVKISTFYQESLGEEPTCLPLLRWLYFLLLFWV